jgi:hypothetical protein
MAAEILLNPGLYVGGARVSSAFNKAMIDGDAALVEMTGFGSTSRKFLKTVLSALASATGFYDPVVEAVLDTEWRSAAGHVFTALKEDNPGMPAWLMLNNLQSVGRGGVIDGASTMLWSAQANGAPAVCRGKSSLRNDALAATGAGTAVQLGATLATENIYAHLHVFSVSVGGTPQVTVKIQSDNASNFPSPTDIGTFVLASAVGAQRIVIPGPFTDDWYRAFATINSAGTFGLMVALSRRP